MGCLLGCVPSIPPVGCRQRCGGLVPLARDHVVNDCRRPDLQVPAPGIITAPAVSSMPESSDLIQAGLLGEQRTAV